MPSLTVAHRAAQADLAVDTVAQMMRLWPLLDIADLDGSYGRWMAAVRGVVDAQHSRSATLAARYYSQLRALKAPKDVARFEPVLADALDARAVAHAMLVAGPVKVKQIIGSGRGVVQATQVAMTHSAGVAARFAAAGGRDTVASSTRADPVAKGWARVGAGDCAFCAMLIARGPVYSEASARFEAHTGCRCSAEPVFGTNYEGKAHADALRERLAAEPFVPKQYSGPRGDLAAAQTPQPLTARQVAAKADTQAAFARSHGWETQIDGRRMTGTKPDGTTIAWELQDTGAWRIVQPQTSP